jgi:hypothetical protein
MRPRRPHPCHGPHLSRAPPLHRMSKERAVAHLLGGAPLRVLLLIRMEALLRGALTGSHTSGLSVAHSPLHLSPLSLQDFPGDDCPRHAKDLPFLHRGRRGLPPRPNQRGEQYLMHAPSIDAPTGNDSKVSWVSGPSHQHNDSLAIGGPFNTSDTSPIRTKRPNPLFARANLRQLFCARPP